MSTNSSNETIDKAGFASFKKGIWHKPKGVGISCLKREYMKKLLLKI